MRTADTSRPIAFAAGFPPNPLVTQLQGWPIRDEQGQICAIVVARVDQHASAADRVAAALDAAAAEAAALIAAASAPAPAPAPALATPDDVAAAALRAAVAPATIAAPGVPSPAAAELAAAVASGGELSDAHRAALRRLLGDAAP